VDLGLDLLYWFVIEFELCTIVGIARLGHDLVFGLGISKYVPLPVCIVLADVEEDLGFYWAL
jgi:hypothetical protein